MAGGIWTASLHAAAAAAGGESVRAGVRLMRVPEGGVQPQVATDAAGVVHLIFLKGDPAATDIFWRRHFRRQSDGCKIPRNLLQLIRRRVDPRFDGS